MLYLQKANGATALTAEQEWDALLLQMIEAHSSPLHDPVRTITVRLLDDATDRPGWRELFDAMPPAEKVAMAERWREIVHQGLHAHS